MTTLLRSYSAASLFALCAGAPSFAQTITVLSKDGDVVPGFGAVTSIDDVSVNDSGTWLVRVDTNAPVSPGDGVVIVSGAIYASEAQALAAPAGSGISSFGATHLDDSGRATWNLFLTGLSTGTDSGIFRGATLIFQEGQNASPPQYSGAAPYTGFFGAKNDGANQILVVASVDDPALTGIANRAIVRFQLDLAGSIVSELVLAKQGDSIVGIAGETIAELSTGRHSWAFNRAAQSMYIADMTGATTSDGVVLIDSTIVAREGDPSPLAGRLYETLIDRPLDLNDAGEWVIRANVDGATIDDDVILKNGTTVIAQEGMTLPAITPFLLTSFATAPVRIDNSGNVFWYGDWDDPITSKDTGIFRNGELIIQEGVTQVNGQTLLSITGVQDGFSISRDGHWLIFRGDLPGSVDAAFLVDLTSDITPYCFGDGSGTPCPCGNVGAIGNGCPSSVNAAGGNLAASGVASVTNDSLVLNGTGMSNSSVLYFQGTLQTAGGAGAVFGDGLRCASGSVIRLATKTNVNGASQYPEPGDQSVSVRGLIPVGGGVTRTYQAWYRNAAAFCNPETFNLTNGVRVDWGS